MPLRGFMYAGKLYDKYIITQHLYLYGPRMISLPTPQYYVFYNGTDESEDRVELRLSDAFADSSVKTSYEWTAIMLNINYGHNKELIDKCKMLKEYARCISMIRDHTKNAEDWQLAIKEAIDICIKEGILADFLTENKSEVVEMLLMEYDEQKVMEQLRKDYQELGLEEGRKMGIQQGIKQGIQQGRSEGLNEGVEIMQFIIQKLVEQKRYSEIAALSTDKSLLDTYIKEFGYHK